MAADKADVKAQENKENKNQKHKNKEEDINQRLTKKQFQAKIRSRVKVLSRQQRAVFARRCALHALPYLYQQGHMDFWPVKKQQHAYAIFNVLDICHANANANAIQGSYHSNINISEAAYAVEAADAAYATYATYAYAAYAAYAAAYSASSAAYSASSADAADAASEAAEAAYYFNATNIQRLLFQTLDAIANNHPPGEPQFDQKLLKNFTQALENENCHYWANLYLKMLTNNFEVDPQELEKRLNVPAEIKDQGAAAVGHYMEQLAREDATLLNEARILILGDKGAGKTCLARRLISPHDDMTTLDESTAGVDTTIWHLEDTNTKVNIWDFAGHTVTHAVHQFFLSERCLYILVYDGRTDNNLSLEYWLDHMKNYGDKSQAVIVANEKDQHKFKIPINKLKEKYPIHDVFYLDIADTKQMEQLQTTIGDLISNNPCWNTQLIPGSYYKVKEDLERLFGKSDDGIFNEHIEIEAFNDLAKSYEITNVEQLLTDLRALGIGLWYPELAKYKKLVLNPEWISHGVYKIINWAANREISSTTISSTTICNTKSYGISLDDFKLVFAGEIDSERFGAEHHQFLFELIKHYELAYESNTDDNNTDANNTDDKSLIIPSLLQEDQPNKNELPSFEIDESLMLEYKAEHPIPPDTITRFIVRHNEQIKQNESGNSLVWRTGVVLGDGEYANTLALVKEDVMARAIVIKAKGDNKSAFIAELRETMNKIFAHYKSDKPELLYRVIPCGPLEQPISLQQPLMLPEQKVINHVQQQRSYFEDNSGLEVDLKHTVINYNVVNANNVIQGQHNRLAIDNSVTTNNYQNCNFALQGDFNHLADELLAQNHKAQAGQLKDVAAALEKIEDCDTPAKVIKSGVGHKISQVIEDLGDKNSSLYKVIEGSKKGVSLAQDMAEKYNSIAQWAGLPQVPSPLLKK